MLKSKIHRATVTDANIHYVGSITIDAYLMELADLAPYEKVSVWDLDNGNRLETYVIEGEKGGGEVCMNGAAARLIQKGDRVIIASFTLVPEELLSTHRPKIIFVDEQNRPELVEDHLTLDDFC